MAKRLSGTETIVAIAKIKVPNDVRKEYHQFLKEYFEEYKKNQFALIIEDSLKITFMKEVTIFIWNGDLTDNQWSYLFFNTDEGTTLETLWKNYCHYELTNETNDFMSQFVHFHASNEKKRRLNKEAVGCLIDKCS